MNPLYYLLVRNEEAFEFFPYKDVTTSQRRVKIKSHNLKDDLWVPLIKPILELDRWMWSVSGDSYDHTIEDARIMWDSLVAIGFERKS